MLKFSPKVLIQIDTYVKKYVNVLKKYNLEAY